MMFSSGTTPSLDKRVHQPDIDGGTQVGQSLRSWLWTWCQVPIAELLHNFGAPKVFRRTLANPPIHSV